MYEPTTPALAEMLFMAVGDAFDDRAPLQVGQFESTAEVLDAPSGLERA